MARKIQLRRDTYTNWYNTNPVLAQGEQALDLTNGKIKIGDGTTLWRDLSYWSDISAKLGNIKIVGGTIGTINSPDVNNGWGQYDIGIDPGGESGAGLYIPGIVSQESGSSMQIYNRGSTNSILQLFGRSNIQLVTDYGNNEKVFMIQDNGSIFFPSVFPKTFTAIYNDTNLISQADPNTPKNWSSNNFWSMPITLNMLADGSIEVNITNNSPFIDNPGYQNGDVFRFTHTEHGLTGYNLDVEFTNLQYPGPAGYTVNLIVTPAPDNPGQLVSDTTFAINVNGHLWALNDEGNLVIPFGGDIVDNTGNSVLNGSGSATTSVAVGQQATVVTGNMSIIGNSTMTAVWGPDNSVDDSSIEISLPFSVIFAGVSYNKVYVSSNSYVVFNNTTGAQYGYIPDAQPGQPLTFIQDLRVPAISIDGADNSYQAVYTKTTGTEFRIRYEGYNATTNQGSPSNILWEMVFNSSTPSTINLIIEENARNGDGTTTITDGILNLGSFDVTPGSLRINTSHVDITGASIKFTNPNTNVELIGDTVSVTVGSQRKEWTNPNGNTWRIDEYSGGVAINYNHPLATYTSTDTVTPTGANEIRLDLTNDQTLLNIFNSNNVKSLTLNNVVYTNQGYGQTSSVISWNATTPTYTPGDTVIVTYYDSTQLPQPVIWWDAANSPNGGQHFRGAIIEYHVFCNYGTIVGSIQIANDWSFSVNHSETVSGNSYLSNYILWDTSNGGALSVKIDDQQDPNKIDNQIWIQWTSKIFYGYEANC